MHNQRMPSTGSWYAAAAVSTQRQKRKKTMFVGRECWYLRRHNMLHKNKTMCTQLVRLVTAAAPAVSLAFTFDVQHHLHAFAL